MRAFLLHSGARFHQEFLGSQVAVMAGLVVPLFTGAMPGVFGERFRLVVKVFFATLKAARK